MKILVANLGSTSFKFKLYDLDGEKQLARGAIDRIGGESSVVSIQIGESEGEGPAAVESTATIADHAVAVGICLDALVDPDTGCLSGVEDVAAIGFKAVFAAELSGVRLRRRRPCWSGWNPWPTWHRHTTRPMSRRCVN